MESKRAQDTVRASSLLVVTATVIFIGLIVSLNDVFKCSSLGLHPSSSPHLLCGCGQIVWFLGTLYTLSYRVFVLIK